MNSIAHQIKLANFDKNNAHILNLADSHNDAKNTKFDNKINKHTITFSDKSKIIIPAKGTIEVDAPNCPSMPHIMVDIFMFKKLLKACKYFDNCSLVLCGDIKQLPPVGKGRPFECIIHSELFNTVYLTEIKRQDTGKLKDCIIKINKKTLSIRDFDNNSTIISS